MDLKDFQNVEQDDSESASADLSKDTKKKTDKSSKKTQPLVDQEFHLESDKIIKDLEARIAAINAGSKTPNSIKLENTHDEAPVEDNSETETKEDEDTETVVVQEGETENFLEKIKPFILPIFLTIFALIFAAIFLYFFSQSRIEKTPSAIVNNQAQPEVIIIKEEKPKVEEVVVVPEKQIPECDPEKQILNEETNECEDLLPEEPAKPSFENGTTTTVKVRFSFDKFNYDNYPRGIYMLSEQIFGEEGQYEDYKILPTSRPDANDMFFGIDRYMVSLLGACQYVVDEADVVVANMKDSQGDQVYSAIKDRYFRGKVVKILNSSKPHIVCGK